MLELLAEPEQGFGEGAREECVQSLSKGNSFNKLVAALFEASLVRNRPSPHTPNHRPSEIIAAPGRVGRGQRRDHAAVRDRNSQPGGDRGAQAFRG